MVNNITHHFYLVNRYEERYMVIFNSDLDNTLIYSYKHNIGRDKTCVEIYENREISFMTNKTFALLKHIKNRVTFVPTTTRTVEQYQRIDLGIGTPQYALACNGGVLLVDGKEDMDWYLESVELARESQSELKSAELFLEKDKYRIFELRNIMGLFVYTKSSEPGKTIEELKKRLDLSLVDVFHNGVKIYVVPKKLSKGEAVLRLKKKLRARTIIAAGDSEFDLSMLQAADIAIAPESLAQNFSFREDGVIIKSDIIFSEGVLKYMMKYKLVKQIKDKAILRQSFIDLAVKVFDLSFADWYKDGFWTDRYIPYVLADNDKVIANASVNIVDTVWQGGPRRYIQIGTVMTDPKYRGQGLSRYLIKEILADWEDKCDCIYLFANNTVLDFYPKFGFTKAKEFQYTSRLIGLGSLFRKLDMDKKEDSEILKQCYQKSNPFSAFPMKDNYGLLMFYCGGPMKDCVYYSKEKGVVCIAIEKEDTLFCYEIFGGDTCSMEEILSGVISPGTEKIVLGFTPKETKGTTCLQLDSEDTLFILSGKENIFMENKVMFPLLSHA